MATGYEQGGSTINANATQGGPHISTEDGTPDLLRGLGAGQPVDFSHGWPQSADARKNQMLLLAQNGYRTIAHDRHGHGRSDQPSDGNELDAYTDDLAQPFEELDLQDAVMVGHSTGCGEVAATSAATTPRGSGQIDPPRRQGRRVDHRRT